MPIRSLKDLSKSNLKAINEELEKTKKKYEKLKGQTANFKINEKKLMNDNTILAQKIQSLNKENSELRHRLSKLMDAQTKTSTSNSNRRLGSNFNRAVKNSSTKQKYIFDNKKHSQVVQSPRLK